MNPADLPPELSNTPELVLAMRQIAQGPLAAQVQAIDQGTYPREVMQQLAAAGGMSAHLELPGQRADFGLAIKAMAEVSKVCGSTGFMMWCQAVCGLYMQTSNNPDLIGKVLNDHVQGLRLGGTGLSNPMKSFAQIESLLLKATPVEGGFEVSGTLPWVSNLGPDHYFGAIAAAFVQVAESVGQIVLPFAIVFCPVEHALDVLRVVGAEDCHRAAPNACACAFAKPVEVSLVETPVAHFRAFCV